MSNTVVCGNSLSSRTSLRGPNSSNWRRSCFDRQLFVGTGLRVDYRPCAKRGKPAYVITPNAQHIVLLEKDRRLQDVYAHADLVIADGISLLIAARLYGRSLQQRIAGVDIFKVLCGNAAETGLHVFLLGGRPGSAELAAANVLRGDFPGLECSTYCPPLGFEQERVRLKQTAEAITGGAA